MIKHLIQRIGRRRSSGRKKSLLDIAAIEKKIQYAFQYPSLLVQAFTHRSYVTVNRSDHSDRSNERLEFLGDAVLDLIVTEHLFSAFPGEDEGILSKKRSVLVSRRVLAQIIDELELGRFLLLNKGEAKTGGNQRHSNLANLFEAVLGAIYLDSDFNQASTFVKTFLLTRRDEFLAIKKYFNHKSDLLEYAQAKGWGYPRYRTVKEEGPDHDKQFEVLVDVNRRWTARGKGKSKKKAEQNAARKLLRLIKQDQNGDEA